MINRFNRQFKLKNIFILSLLFCSVVSYLGPYNWKIYSWSGLLFYYVFEILFFFGLCSGGVVVSRKNVLKKKEKHFKWTTYRKCVIIFSSLVSIIGFLYFLYNFRMSFSNYKFGLSYTFEYQENRDYLEKVFTVFMGSGMAAHIIYSKNSDNKRGFVYWISLFAFWTFPLRQLLMGARFASAVSVIVYCFMYKDRFKMKIKAKTKIYISIILLLAFIAFMYLFATRFQHLTVDTVKEFYPGDHPLKDYGRYLYDRTDGAFFPVLLLVDYIGEAPFVFSGMWDLVYPKRILFGANHFRVINLVLNQIGISPLSTLEVVAISYGGYAKYSGIGFAMLVDFGLFFGMIFAYVSGLIFAKIEKHRNDNLLYSSIYPCLIPICIFAPIYDLCVGRLDFTIFFIIVLWFMLRLNVNTR